MIVTNPSARRDPNPSKTPQQRKSRPFLVKEIALQAGVSAATVDRVLNGREGVRERTVARVMQALRELEQQCAWTAARGQILVVDILVEAPRIYINALAAAMEEELALSAIGAFRVRRDMRPAYPPAEMGRALHQVARRGSDGAIVMGPDSPPVHEGIAAVVAAGIPIVTLTTDSPNSARQAYVGMDNRRAGLTAAWFMQRWLPDGEKGLVVTMRNPQFRGEAERLEGFLDGISRHCRQGPVSVLVQDPKRRDIGGLVRAAAGQGAGIGGLYSIGGSNLRICAALRDIGVRPKVHIAQDLDAENLELMRAGQLDVLIYQDLREDIRNALLTLIALRSKGRIALPDASAALRLMMPTMLT